MVFRCIVSYGFYGIPFGIISKYFYTGIDDVPKIPSALAFLGLSLQKKDYINFKNNTHTCAYERERIAQKISAHGLQILYTMLRTYYTCYFRTISE